MDFTARNVTKRLVTSAIHMKTASLSKDAIADHTSIDSDSIAVKLAASTVGWYVSDKVKPYSDKMVDKTFDFVAAKRAEYKTKKNDRKKKDD